MADSAGSRRANSNTEPKVRPVKIQPESRWLAPGALAVALIATGLAIWALLSQPDPTPTAAPQDGDSKTRVCNAFGTVSRAVQLQTNADLGPEPVAQKAVAGNARLAIIGGGDYLLRQVDADTPKELADAVRAFANNLQEIGMNALAEVPGTDPAQAARLKDGEASRVQIADMCK